MGVRTRVNERIAGFARRFAVRPRLDPVDRRKREVVDGTTGEVRICQLFVATLGASNYTYAEATFSQRLFDWIGSHVRAFAFFGGVTAQIVSDNLRSGALSPVAVGSNPEVMFACLKFRPACCDVASFRVGPIASLFGAIPDRVI